MNETVFTPASVLSLLANMDELADYDISLTETLDGELQLVIGDSAYLLEPELLTDIEVDLKVVEEIESVNEEAYQDLTEQYEGYSSDVDSLDTVESGILKEAAKSLLLGGMIRLSAKLLTK